MDSFDSSDSWDYNSRMVCSCHVPMQVCQVDSCSYSGDYCWSVALRPLDEWVSIGFVRDTSYSLRLVDRTVGHRSLDASNLCLVLIEHSWALEVCLFVGIVRRHDGVFG